MRYDFQMQTVTEVFAGGANPQAAEPRPSEFHGLMRFWFRTMMGKFVGNDLDALHRLERAAFGFTDASAPFVLRLSDVPAADRPDFAVPLPFGKAYLGFPFYEFDEFKEGDDVAWYRVNRSYIPAGKTFTLSLRFKVPDAMLQNVVLGSLWLLFNFGAIGSRTRRGFGVLKALSAHQGDTPLFYFAPSPSMPIGDFYSRGRKLVEGWFGTFAGGAAGGGDAAGEDAEPENTEYGTFGAWEGRLVVRDDVKDADRWFDDWGLFLRLFRNDEIAGTQPGDWQVPSGNYLHPRFSRGLLRQRTLDYRRVITHCIDGTDPVPDDLQDPSQPEHLKTYLRNDVLGLPIVVRSSRRRKSRTVAWRVPGESQDRRRASPLFLRPVLLPDGRVACLCVFFIGHFLPDEAGMGLPYGEYDSLELDPPNHRDIRRAAERFTGEVKRLFAPRAGHPGDLLLTLPEP